MAKGKRPIPEYKRRYTAFQGPKRLVRDKELKLYCCELGVNVAVGLDAWQKPEDYIAGDEYVVRGKFLQGIGSTMKEAVLEAFKKLDEIPPHQRLKGD